MQNKTELGEQQAVMEWAKLSTGRYPKLALLYHIPNEGKRSFVNGAALKKAGLSAGVPDLCLAHPSGAYHALYIEMKKDRHSRTTQKQDEWIEVLNAAGNFAVVCYSADEAIATLKKYVTLKEDERMNNYDI